MKPYLAVPSIALLVHRAWSRKSLTPLGLIAAALTAVAHAVHPWSVPFFLLVVFYIGGTTATKVKHDVKSRLTLSASGAAGGEGQRNHIQVLANSIVATVLILLHTRSLQLEDGTGFSLGRNTPESDVLVVGIVANYAAVAADTFSSELGILSNSKPRLITSLSLRVVPPGTNGGVTATGLLAGVLGAFTVAITSAVLLPFDLSEKHSGGGGGLYVKERAVWALVMTVWGALGSVLDSVLGSLVQASVVDKMTGKVVEGSGGRKVLIHRSSSRSGRTAEASSSVSHDTSSPESVHLRQTEAVANAAALKGSRATHRTHEPEQESRRVESGRDLLDNNTVNVSMAAMMSLGGMGGAAWLWGVLPL